MNVLLLEVLVAFTAFAVLWTLSYSIVRHKVETQPGSRFLIAGFLLLFLSSLIDITDNFPSLNQYVLIGNTSVEAII